MSIIKMSALNDDDQDLVLYPGQVFISPFEVKYTIQKHLEHGFDSEIYAATSNKFKDPVAMKFIDAHNDNDYIKELMAYVYISADPYCKENIVCLLDAFMIDYYNPVIDDTQTYGVLVFDLMNPITKVPDEDIPNLILALLNGLITIHEAGFAHAHITLENILFKDDSNGKRIFQITDLGDLCTHYPIDTQVEIQTSPAIKTVYKNFAELPLISICSTLENQYDENIEEIQDEDELINAYDNLAFENAKQEDIHGLGLTLYSLIFDKLYYEDQKGQFNKYPRKEPNQVPSGVILNLLKRMLISKEGYNYSARELWDYFVSNLRQ